ncbi:MAG: hypothetical protein J6Z22_06385 [Lachnospiraceae bacterium]|nr:hypothetical protein [Lachnospiraceae bacterium]
MADIKEQITKVVEKVTKDEKLMDQFKKDPVKAVESVIGVDLPDDMVNKVVDGVKAKISIDKLGGIANSLKNIF